MALSEWLQIMLAEIARKREDLERAREEEVKRDTEKVGEAHSEAAPRNLTTR
jgi:hypothetical protein